MENFINIEIPYKSSIATLLLSYAASFNECTNFRCENIKIFK